MRACFPTRCIPILRCLLMLGMAAGVVEAQQTNWFLHDGVKALAAKPRRIDVRVTFMGFWAQTEIEFHFRAEGAARQFVWLPAEGQRLSGYGYNEKTALAVVCDTAIPKNVVQRPVSRLQARHPNALTIDLPKASGQGFNVRVAWEEMLALHENGYRYLLPLPFLAADTLALSVTAQNQMFAPELRLPGLALPAFRQLRDDQVLINPPSGFSAQGPMRIFIPCGLEPWQVHWEKQAAGTAFVLQGHPALRGRPRKLPHSVALLWDVSLSGLQRDHALEIATLQRFAKACGTLKLTLIPFHFRPESPQQFVIKDGDLSELAAAIQQLPYDGATELSRIPWSDLDAECIVLVGDGKSTWSLGQMPRVKQPVLAFHAGPAGDSLALKALCDATGGSYIGRIQDDSLAAKRLLWEPVRVVELRGPASLRDLHCLDELESAQRITCTGLIHGNQTRIRIGLGYGKDVVEKEKLVLRNHRLEKVSEGSFRRWARMHVDAGKPSPELLELCMAQGLESPWTQLAFVDDSTAFLAGRAQPHFPKNMQDSLQALRAELRIFQDTLRQRGLQERSQALIDTWRDREFWWKGNALPTREKKSDTLGLDTLYRFQGWVGDARDSLPLTGVEVASPPDTGSSDRTGRFQLMLPQPKSSLHFSYPAYFGKIVPAQSEAFQRIYLSPQAPTRRIQTALLRAETPILLPTRAIPHHPSAYLIDGQLYPQVSDSILNDALEIAWLDGDWTRFRLGADAGAGVVSVVTHEGQKQGWRTDSRIRPVPWDSLTRYIPILEKASAASRYASYVKLRETYGHMPAFFMDVGHWFMAKGDSAAAMRIWSNLNELECDEAPLDRSLGHHLLALGEADAALNLFARARALSPEVPQAIRDHALALEAVGKEAEAAQLLTMLVLADWSEVSDWFGGIEAVMLNELFGLLTRAQLPKPASLPAQLRPLPLDLRVTAEWNRMEADVDLWVVDPDSERCDHKHRETALGGYFPVDFADGYGPEEFLLRAAKPGGYRIGIDFYDEDRANMTGACEVRVRVYTHFGSPQVRVQTYDLRLEGLRDTREILLLTWPEKE